MDLINLTGKRFGIITVIKRAQNRAPGKAMWDCICDCGNKRTLDAYYLSHHTKSCGCLNKLKRNHNFKDLTGMRFGLLSVISYDKFEKLPLWLCKCDCGNIKSVYTQSLKKGLTQSCGCLRSKITSIRSATHRLSATKIYRAWSKIKARCYNQDDPRYKTYGARGITVCKRWKHSFENFLEDMGQPPSQDRKYSIDRINNNQGYSKKNCRWATHKQQTSNTTRTRLVTCGKETHHLSAWMKKLKQKSNSSFYLLLKKGYSEEKTIKILQSRLT